MYFIYILHSSKSNTYYVGYTNNIERRLSEHNNSDHNSFTFKNRPWVLKAAFSCGADKSTAITLERFIKMQKSRRFLEQLCAEDFVPKDKLAPLVKIYCN